MKSIVSAVAGAIVVFGLFSFFNVGFNISLWSMDSRFCCAMGMLAGAFVGAMFTSQI